MPKSAALIGLAALSLLVLLKSSAAEELLLWRLSLGPGLVPDLPLLLSQALSGGPISLRMTILASSLLGWGSLALLFRRQTKELWAPLSFHPATLLLTGGGLGLAAASLVLLFLSQRRLLRTGDPADVPLIGLALLTALLFVPRFEVLLIAAVSPLFFIAPRSMLEGNMSAFYVVVLTPALFVLAAAAIFYQPQTEPRSSAAAASIALAAALPAGIFLFLPRSARAYVWLLLFPVAAAALYGWGTPLMPVAMAGLASGFAAAASSDQTLSLASGGATVLAILAAGGA